jgi:hypothetical protein
MVKPMAVRLKVKARAAGGGRARPRHPLASADKFGLTPGGASWSYR